MYVQDLELELEARTVAHLIRKSIKTFTASFDQHCHKQLDPIYSDFPSPSPSPSEEACHFQKIGGHNTSFPSSSFNITKKFIPQRLRLYESMSPTNAQTQKRNTKGQHNSNNNNNKTRIHQYIFFTFGIFHSLLNVFFSFFSIFASRDRF